MVFNASRSSVTTGVAPKDNVIRPALVVIGVALVLFVGCLAAFATRHHDVGLMLGSASAAGFVIGSLWMAIEHVRVRRIEERWYAEHPEVTRQRPPS